MKTVDPFLRNTPVRTPVWKLTRRGGVFSGSQARWPWQGCWGGRGACWDLPEASPGPQMGAWFVCRSAPTLLALDLVPGLSRPCPAGVRRPRSCLPLTTPCGVVPALSWLSRWVRPSTWAGGLTSVSLMVAGPSWCVGTRCGTLRAGSGVAQGPLCAGGRRQVKLPSFSLPRGSRLRTTCDG